MNYNIIDIRIVAIDQTGGVVGTATVLNGGTIYSKLTIGVRYRLSVRLRAVDNGSAGEEENNNSTVIDGHELKCNFGLFGAVSAPNKTKGYKATISENTEIQALGHYLGMQSATNLNGAVIYTRVNSTEGVIGYEFRMLADMNGFAPVPQSNDRRLTADVASSGGVRYNNQGNSVFGQTRYLQFWCYLNGEYASYNGQPSFAQPVKARFWDGAPGMNSQIGFRRITSIKNDVNSASKITDITRGATTLQEETTASQS
ncbi:MAG: hypothetical protein ACPGXZ_00790 [Saprospiraceae bacterium]